MTTERKPRKLTVSETRQKAIDAALDAMGSISATFQQDDPTGALEELKSEIEEVRDNLEEHFGGTDRYQIISDACDALDEAISAVQAIGEAIEEAESQLGNISFE